MTHATVKVRGWRAHEIVIAADIWQRTITDIYGDDDWTDGAKRRAYQLIAHKLGRTSAAVAGRFKECGPSFTRDHRTMQSGISLQALAERDLRYEAVQLRDLTASIMGDPAPGYSALDHRNMVTCLREAEASSLRRRQAESGPSAGNKLA